LLEYIGYFNEFQRGALSKFYKKPLSQEVANEYIKLYIDWKGLLEDKKKTQEAEQRH